MVGSSGEMLTVSGILLGVNGGVKDKVRVIDNIYRLIWPFTNRSSISRFWPCLTSHQPLT